MGNKEYLITLIIATMMLVFLVFFFLFIVFFFIDEITMEKMRVEKVECYDRYGNEIKDLVCVDEIYCGIIKKILSKEYCYGGS